MGDRDVPLRPEEQYPLLKVDAGGDVTAHPQTTQIISPGWSITCAKKQSWISKWPEFISACWMTMIVFGISFLVFYAIGMGAYRRQQYIIVKCNTSKPADNVFFHHIIQRGGQIVFNQFSDYLSYMAFHYPYLHFNVIFLMDDSFPAPPSSRHARFMTNKFIPYYPNPYYGVFSNKLDENSKLAISEFQRKYQNVNITIMPLSKFMAITPLRYRWKIVPLSFLAFYTRVFSVWENGGIGMDLSEFNNQFNSHHQNDRRVTAILKQHNNGINPENYASALNKIDKDEQNALFSMLYGLINQFLNETKSLFNRTLPFPLGSSDKPAMEPYVRIRRSLHESNNISAPGNSSEPKNSINNLDNIITNMIAHDFNNTDMNYMHPAYSSENDGKDHVFNDTEQKMAANNDTPKFVLYYDFFVFSDNIGPPYMLPELPPPSLSSSKFKKYDGNQAPTTKSATHFVSLDIEGTFIAASTKLHPFLGHLVASGWQRLVPKLSIREAILSQCSGLLKNDDYCNNIYIL